ncbi:MAG: radical SAM protein [Elusimicrobiota bacterium]|jgi:radical SAM protein with 4Fe4S-binding SPASM domain
MNFWSDFEYNKLKLLLNPKKVQTILDVYNRTADYDSLPPISIELHLTNVCNLNCSWCTDRRIRDNQTSQRKEDLLRLFTYCAKNNVGVTIEGGGEPTLHPDFLELLAHAATQGLHLGMLTNGVKDVSQFAGQFDWIRFSLDAGSRKEFLVEKGADMFDQVLTNLGRLASARDPQKTHVGVGYVLTNRNIAAISELLVVLDRIGVDYIYFRPIEETPELLPSTANLLDLKKALIAFSDISRIRPLLTINERLIASNDHLPCVAHSLACIIHADGDVVLCEKRRHDPITLGNLRTSSFEDIWHSDIRRSATRKLLHAENQSGCSVCRITSFNRVFCDVNSVHTRHFI